MTKDVATNTADVDKINMVFPCKGEYVGVVRLTISAIANRMGFNIEEIEDIKVAVSEGCTNAIKHSQDENFDLIIDVFDDKLQIVIRDSGKGYDVDNLQGPDLENPKEHGLGIFIMRTLMDEVELKSQFGTGSEIKLIKFLGDGR